MTENNQESVDDPGLVSPGAVGLPPPTTSPSGAGDDFDYFRRVVAKRTRSLRERAEKSEDLFEKGRHRIEESPEDGEE